MSTPDYQTLTARALLDSEAFMIRPEEPFVLTSGLRAPFYVNCRKLIFHPGARGDVAAAFAERIASEIGTGAFDVVAGGVTAGVPFATLVADRLQKPLVYIRPEPKKHGTGSQIEGGDVAGKRVLLVEDLITTSKSITAFTQILRRENASIDHACVVFSRATEAGLAQIADLNVQLHVLCGLDHLLAIALESGRVSEAQLAEVRAFTADPEGWSAARG